MAVTVYEVLDGYVVGSANRTKIHSPDCESVQSVPIRSLVVFRSIEHGKKQGYTLCGYCEGDPMTAATRGVSVRSNSKSVRSKSTLTDDALMAEAKRRGLI